MKKLILIMTVLFVSCKNISTENRTILEILRKVIDTIESRVQLV